jgi:hypothetical protein
MRTSASIRLAHGDRGAAHAAPIDGIELALLVAFFAVAAVGWSGIALAEAGWFGGTAVAVTSAAVLFVLLRVLAHDAAVFDVDTLRVPRADIACGLALVAASAVCYLPPAEHLFDGADSTVYLNVGARLAQTGSLRFPDPVLELADGIPLETLFARDLNPPPLMHRFRGGIQIAPDGAHIVPNFFHFYSVWIAVLTLPFGLTGALYLNPALATGGVLTTWAIGRRLWSNAAGVAAAALLLVSFGQVWFAGFASSEMLAQYLVLSGVLFASACARGAPRVVGLAAGLAFGLASFTRVDALFLIAPAIGLLLVVVRAAGAWSPSWTLCAVTLALVTAHAAAHAFTIAGPYTLRVLVQSARLARLPILLGGVALVLLAVLVVRWLPRATAAARGRMIDPRVRLTLALLPAGFAALAALVLQVNPLGGHFATLMTPAGVILMFAGLGLLFAFGLRLDRIVLLLVFVPSAILYLHSTRERGEMPLLFRRFVPVILPAAMLFIGSIVGTLGRPKPGQRRPAWAALAGLAVYGAFLARDSLPIVRSRPMRGIAPQLEALAEGLPPDGLVLFDRVAPSHLALTLAYAFDRPTLVVDRTAGLQALVRRALDRGHRVHAFVRPDAHDERRLTRTDLRRFALVPRGDVTLRYDALVSSRDALPRTIESRSVTLQRYEVVSAAGAAARVAVPAVVDIGGMDFAHVLGGFHGAESMGGVTARWTLSEAHVIVPPIDRGEAASLRLTASLAAYRPAGVAGPEVTIELDGVRLGHLAPASGQFREYAFDIPEPLVSRLAAGATTLLIRASTFRPSQAGLRDDRVLGVAVDAIRIEAARALSFEP